MRKMLKSSYLANFLFNAITFGTLMSAWEYYDTGKVIVLKQVLQAVFFGAVMSWITVRSYRRAQSKKEEEEKKEDQP